MAGSSPPGPMPPLVRATLPAGVTVTQAEGRLPHLDISTPAAVAQVFFHGAHIAHWKPAQSREPVLWMSAHSVFRPDKAIRGGVPVCFPWFGVHPTDPAAPSHGFARLADWTLVEAGASPDGVVTLGFELPAAPIDAWPHAARVTYYLSIGTTLRMSLEVENIGGEPFSFEEALHTYFAVEDVEQIAIHGLENGDYLDKPEGFARKRQPDEPIRFAGETDRVYLDTAATCRIDDPLLKRTIVIEKSDSRSTVVWNPGPERARAFSDFGASEWRQMVCVETANVGRSAVRLVPGARHVMTAHIILEPQSSRQ